MFQKIKPLKSKLNLDKVRNMRCLVCDKMPCDPHHIITRGAGGGDELHNLANVCREHHTQWHAKGLVYMMDKYDNIYKFIKTYNQRAYNKYEKLKELERLSDQ